MIKNKNKTNRRTSFFDTLFGILFALVFFVLLFTMPIKYFFETYDTYTETTRESFTVTSFYSKKNAYDLEFQYDFEGKPRATAVPSYVYNTVSVGDTVVCDVVRYYKNKSGKYTKSVFVFVDLKKKNAP